jgi:hypothetical protein
MKVLWSWTLPPRRWLPASVVFGLEVRDCWIGVYWTDETREDIHGVTFLRFRSVYVCLIPCFPIRLRWYR